MVNRPVLAVVAPIGEPSIPVELMDARTVTPVAVNVVNVAAAAVVPPITVESIVDVVIATPLIVPLVIAATGDDVGLPQIGAAAPPCEIST